MALRRMYRLYTRMESAVSLDLARPWLRGCGVVVVKSPFHRCLAGFGVVQGEVVWRSGRLRSWSLTQVSRSRSFPSCTSRSWYFIAFQVGKNEPDFVLRLPQNMRKCNEWLGVSDGAKDSTSWRVKPGMNGQYHHYILPQFHR